MEEGSDELERKIEKLNAQLARQTARAEKVHCPALGFTGAGGGVAFGVEGFWDSDSDLHWKPQGTWGFQWKSEFFGFAT